MIANNLLCPGASLSGDRGTKIISTMRIALAIVKLFPGGGLQRDCVEIARIIRRYGHDVVIFTSKKDESDFADDLEIIVLPGKTQTNHRTQTTFSANFLAAADGFDLLVGFDKLSGLDILYCADASMYYRIERAPYLHLMRRYRAFKDLEGESFRVGKKTKILMLSHTQLNEYWSVWNTEPDRLILLPPTVAASRRKPEHRINGTRAEMRRELGLSADDWVWITVCVQPSIKGLDRIALALRQFPRARVLVAGLTETSTPATKKIANLARRLGVSSRIKWLGHHENIPQLMAAADLFLRGNPASQFFEERRGASFQRALFLGLHAYDRDRFDLRDLFFARPAL